MTIRFRSGLATAGLAALLLTLVGACGDDDAATDAGTSADGRVPNDADLRIDAGPPTTPTVIANTPISGATGVPLNSSLSATFSEPMNSATIGATSFTVTAGDPAVVVPGTVIYTGVIATFWPAEQFTMDTMYAATITTGATNAAGVALAADYSWRFTTGNTRAPGLPVDLGGAGDFVILAKTGIDTVPTSAVTGDVGISPAAATFITGFSLSADSTNVFATSPQVTGMVYAANYAVPTPSNLTTSVSDMLLAFTDAAGRAPDVTELGAGNIGGTTIARGVYRWSTGLLIPTDVTLTGSATDVWIFQIAQNLTMESGARVRLSGGALAKNVFWQVSGLVDLGTTGHLEGAILSSTSITLRTGASVNGRLLAQTAVNIDGSTVVEPTE